MNLEHTNFRTFFMAVQPIGCGLNYSLKLSGIAKNKFHIFVKIGRIIFEYLITTIHTHYLANSNSEYYF